MIIFFTLILWIIKVSGNWFFGEWKDLGYGKDYKYNPNFTEPVEQDYLPEELKGRKYFEEKKK